MDFSNRGTSGSDNQQMGHAPASNNQNTKRKSVGGDNKWMKIGQVVFGAIILVLVVALLAYLTFNNSNSSNESSYVKSNQLQAVFLNTGQVYFGNLKSINSNYFVLDNIYYLQTQSNGSTSTSSTSGSSVSLVKLGCELHAPYDQMIINSSQVTFWENLKSNGQVAKAVAAFEKANPNGQTCSNTNSTASSTNTNTVQPSTANTVKTTK